MDDALFVIIVHSTSEGFFFNDFSYIFVYERVSWNGGVCTDAITFFVGLDYVDVGVFTALETLVATGGAAGTFVVGAFHRRGKVDTIVVSAGQVCSIL